MLEAREDLQAAHEAAQTLTMGQGEPMSDHVDRQALARELREVDEALTQLRTANEPRSTDPEDVADAAADLTNQEEEQALMANLEVRHAELSKQLTDG